MAKYPIYLELGGQRVVVIGAGNVAIRKVQSLLEVGARVVVVADRIDDMMTAMCKDTDTELITSKYSKSYLPGAVMVIASTSDTDTNARIYKDCQELEILCNVVDDPPHCDFYVPALVKRGELQIAIGTNSNCPAYAGHIRRKLEDIFTETHGEFLVELEKMRNYIFEHVPELPDRKSLLGKLVKDESFDYFSQNGSESWNHRAVKIVDDFLKQN